MTTENPWAEIVKEIEERRREESSETRDWDGDWDESTYREGHDKFPGHKELKERD